MLQQAATEPLLRLEAIYKQFGSLEVLHGIDLTVSSGEVVAIIGPSGSGKSTLLRCINLLEPPTSGRISWLALPWKRGTNPREMH